MQGGGNIRASMGGGAHFADEEESKYAVNGNGTYGDKTPLIEPSPAHAMDVSIAQIAGTIEADEKARLKKLIFRATRGKALTFFYDFSLP